MRQRPIRRGDGRSAYRAVPLLFGVFLVVLARGVADRRWLAWAVLVGGSTLAMPWELAARHPPQHPVRAVAATALAMACMALRAEFGTRPDPRRVRSAGRVAAASCCCSSSTWPGS